jgi:hypothetical protein
MIKAMPSISALLELKTSEAHSDWKGMTLLTKSLAKVNVQRREV